MYTRTHPISSRSLIRLIPTSPPFFALCFRYPCLRHFYHLFVYLSVCLGELFFVPSVHKKRRSRFFSVLLSPPPTPPPRILRGVHHVWEEIGHGVFILRLFRDFFSLSFSLPLFLSFFLSSFSSNVIFSSSVIFNRAPPPPIVVFAGRGSLFFKGLSKDAG